MPTRLGNVLRTGEQYGRTRYELDPIVVWDALLASVPTSLAENQANRRTSLDLFVSMTVLPVLFALVSIHSVVTTPVTWTRWCVAVAAGGVICTMSYVAATESAKSYADSVSAIVEIGRRPLAAALGLTIPATHDAERELWRAVCGLAFWGDAVSREEGWIETLENARRRTASDSVDDGQRE